MQLPGKWAQKGRDRDEGRWYGEAAATVTAKPLRIFWSNGGECRGQMRANGCKGGGAWTSRRRAASKAAGIETDRIPWTAIVASLHHVQGSKITNYEGAGSSRARRLISRQFRMCVLGIIAQKASPMTSETEGRSGRILAL
jgi:hypothetical protein